MGSSRVSDLERLEHRFNSALDRRRCVDQDSRLQDNPAEAVARAQLRWAVWCLECLRELREIVDLTDSRGLGLTPQGFRPMPTAMGHIMWAAATAMGALDRVAAAFGALHLRALPRGRIHDLESLIRSRSQLPPKHAVISWLDAVEHDSAYSDLLRLLRHPLIHRTTPMALFARVGGELAWEDRPPHQDAPGSYLPDGNLCLDPTYRRSVTAVEFLEETIPSTEGHVEGAIDLFYSGVAF